MYILSPHSPWNHYTGLLGPPRTWYNFVRIDDYISEYSSKKFTRRILAYSRERPIPVKLQRSTRLTETPKISTGINGDTLGGTMESCPLMREDLMVAMSVASYKSLNNSSYLRKIFSDPKGFEGGISMSSAAVNRQALMKWTKRWSNLSLSFSHKHWQYASRPYSDRPMRQQMTGEWSQGRMGSEGKGTKIRGW